jgi:hypothetical protein
MEKKVEMLREDTGFSLYKKDLADANLGNTDGSLCH